jgi:hypothetical protein
MSPSLVQAASLESTVAVVSQTGILADLVVPVDRKKHSGPRI